MGVGFTLSLTLIALIREVLGSGTITLLNLGEANRVVLTLPGLSESPIRVMTLAAGALLVMGYLKAFFVWNSDRKAKRGER